MSPKMTKMRSEKMPKKLIFRDTKYYFLKGIYGPAFSENRRIPRYCRQTLHICFFAIRRRKLRKTSKLDVKMHPETHQNLTTSMPEKNTDFWHRFGVDFDLKNVPKMTPKSSKMAPLGSQGATWQAMGSTRSPQIDFSPNWLPK